MIVVFERASSKGEFHVPDDDLDMAVRLIMSAAAVVPHDATWYTREPYVPDPAKAAALRKVNQEIIAKRQGYK